MKHTKTLPSLGAASCSLFLILLAETARAQSIVGNVKTAGALPVQGVLVTGTRTSPFQQVTDTTDASGNYSLSSGILGLSGTYNVVPGKSGYTFTPASPNVTVTAHGGTRP